MGLTVDEPQIHWQAAARAVAAAAAYADAKGLRVNIAVVDRGGNLLAFQRINGAPLHSITIAEDKAYTAVSFGFATNRWMAAIGDLPQLREGLVHRPRLVIFGGGFPIAADGVVVGGIGVSGGSEAEDEACAKAGLEAIGVGG